jgi:hypothetical protein
MSTLLAAAGERPAPLGCANASPLRVDEAQSYAAVLSRGPKTVSSARARRS